VCQVLLFGLNRAEEVEGGHLRDLRACVGRVWPDYEEKKTEQHIFLAELQGGNHVVSACTHSVAQ
jgi:hypothetical protein